MVTVQVTVTMTQRSLEPIRYNLRALMLCVSYPRSIIDTEWMDGTRMNLHLHPHWFVQWCVGPRSLGNERRGYDACVMLYDYYAWT